MDEDTKAWVWTDVLTDYTSGLIVAEGETPADARERAAEDDDIPGYVVREMHPENAEELENVAWVYGGA